MGTTVQERATERVVVLMTPRQKAAARSRAKQAQLSLGDFIRRRTFDEISSESAMLTDAARQLADSTRIATAALDAALTRLASMQSGQLARTRRALGSAKTEFADIDPEAFADIVAPRGDHA